MNPELVNVEEYVKLFAGLLAMSNILSHVPFFLSATHGQDRAGATKAALGASLSFGILLCAVAIFSTELLAAFNISIAAFQTAGGVLIFLNGLNMVRHGHAYADAADTGPINPFVLGVTPLGVPMLAGAGSISFVLIAASIHPGDAHTVVVTIAVLAVALAIFVTLCFASFVGNFVSASSHSFIAKLLGLIILAIGVEYIFHGVAAHFGLETFAH